MKKTNSQPDFKLIPQGIDQSIEYLLITTPNRLIYKNILIQIIDVIFSNNRVQGDYGKIVYRNDFLRSVTASKDVIDRHINFLISNNILERSNKTFTETEITFDISTLKSIKKLAPYQYRLNPDYKLTSFEQFVYKVISNLDDEPLNVSSIDNSPIKNDYRLKMLRVIHHIVSVDIYGALEYLFKTDFPNKKNQDAFKINQARILYRIALKSVKVNYGTSVNRIYSNITKLSSDLHKFIYLGRKSTTEIDARASQLTLISFLARKYGFGIDNQLHKIIDNPDLDIYDVIKDHLVDNYDKINVVKKSNKSTWIEPININDYVTDDAKETRNNIKKDVYSAIFSGFNNKTTVCKVMRDLFGEVINPLLDLVGKKSVFQSIRTDNIHGVYFKTLKPKKVSRLAEVLQNLEAEIFLDTALQLFEDGVFVLTKHDSLICCCADQIKVLNALKARYKELGFYHINNHHLKKESKVVQKVFIQPVIQVIEIEAGMDLSKIQAAAFQPNRDLTVYEFVHKDTNESFTGTRSEFVKEFNLKNSGVGKLIKGKLKSYKKWVLNN